MARKKKYDSGPKIIFRKDLGRYYGDFRCFFPDDFRGKEPLIDTDRGERFATEDKTRAQIIFGRRLEELERKVRQSANTKALEILPMCTDSFFVLLTRVCKAPTLEV